MASCLMADGQETKSSLIFSRWINIVTIPPNKQHLPVTNDDKLRITKKSIQVETAKERDLARVPRRVSVPSARATGAFRARWSPRAPLFSSFVSFFVGTSYLSCVRTPWGFSCLWIRRSADEIWSVPCGFALVAVEEPDFGGKKMEEPHSLKSNEMAQCSFQPQQPLVCDTFKNCEGLSRVAFMDGNGVVMLGKVVTCERKEGDDKGGKKK